MASSWKDVLVPEDDEILVRFTEKGAQLCAVLWGFESWDEMWVWRKAYPESWEQLAEVYNATRVALKEFGVVARAALESVCEESEEDPISPEETAATAAQIGFVLGYRAALDDARA